MRGIFADFKLLINKKYFTHHTEPIQRHAISELGLEQIPNS